MPEWRSGLLFALGVGAGGLGGWLGYPALARGYTIHAIAIP